MLSWRIAADRNRSRRIAAVLACALVAGCDADAVTGRAPDGGVHGPEGGRDAPPPDPRDGATHDADSGDFWRGPDAAPEASPGSPESGRPDAGAKDAALDAAADGATAPRFTEVAAAAGVTYVQAYTHDCPGTYLHECEVQAPYMTGGAAAADVTGDGHVDLVVTRFDGPALLLAGRGDGTFAPGTELPTLPRTNGVGCADLDGDGDVDVYLTLLGDTRYQLLINDGTGHFTEEAEARGAAVSLPISHQGTSVSFGDYDRDGYLDVHVGEWRRAPGDPPNARLLHNLGASAPGTFEDVTDAAGVSAATADGVFVFSSAFSDLDDDGWPDLAVVADYGTSRLFWNRGDGTFADGTRAARVGTEANGMGSAIADFDGDGRLDWFVSAIMGACMAPSCPPGVKPGNRLFRNAGGRVFEDATDTAGVRDASWAWGSSFFDHDNDGDQDLVVTAGIDFPDLPDDGPFHAPPIRHFRNEGGGAFTEVGAETGLGDRVEGKGLLVFDPDEDGDLDVFVVRHAGAPRLYRNDGGNRSGWLRLRLVGSASSRTPFGARVTVVPSPGATPLVQELTGGSNYLAQNEPVLHFGLGPGTASVPEVRIRWPRTGAEQVLTDVARDAVLTVVEP